VLHPRRASGAHFASGLRQRPTRAAGGRASIEEAVPISGAHDGLIVSPVSPSAHAAAERRVDGDAPAELVERTSRCVDLRPVCRPRAVIQGIGLPIAIVVLEIGVGKAYRQIGIGFG
jgi:hypothetical protein